MMAHQFSIRPGNAYKRDGMDAVRGNVAHVCNRERELGTVEEGKIADILVVEGDPGFPNAICNHLSYQVWGPGNNSGEVVIAFGKGWTPLKITREGLSEIFSEVTQVATIEGNKYSAGFEKNLPVFICRKPRHSLKEVWKQYQNYY